MNSPNDPTSKALPKSLVTHQQHPIIPEDSRRRVPAPPPPIPTISTPMYMGSAVRITHYAAHHGMPPVAYLQYQEGAEDAVIAMLEENVRVMRSLKGVRDQKVKEAIALEKARETTETEASGGESKSVQDEIPFGALVKD